MLCWRAAQQYECRCEAKRLRRRRRPLLLQREGDSLHLAFHSFIQAPVEMRSRIA